MLWRLFIVGETGWGEGGIGLEPPLELGLELPDNLDSCWLELLPPIIALDPINGSASLDTVCFGLVLLKLSFNLDLEIICWSGDPGIGLDPGESEFELDLGDPGSLRDPVDPESMVELAKSLGILSLGDPGISWLEPGTGKSSSPGGGLEDLDSSDAEPIGDRQTPGDLQ